MTATEHMDPVMQARVAAATAAYCSAWCSDYDELGLPVPGYMRDQAGPAYEATKRCMVEALLAADRVVPARRR